MQIWAVLDFYGPLIQNQMKYLPSSLVSSAVGWTASVVSVGMFLNCLDTVTRNQVIHETTLVRNVHIMTIIKLKVYYYPKKFILICERPISVGLIYCTNTQRKRFSILWRNSSLHLKFQKYCACGIGHTMCSWKKLNPKKTGGGGGL